MSIVETIKLLCREKGVSFNQFEKESGVGRGTAAKWDTNSPSVDKVKKAADYFGVSVGYLLGTENKPTTQSDELEEFIKLLKAASPELQAAALAVLRSAENKGGDSK